MDKTPDRLNGIDGTQPLLLQSGQLLMIADELGLVNHRTQIDPTEPRDLAQIYAEIGPHIALCDDPRLLKEPHWYLRVLAQDGSRIPVIAATSEVRAFVAGVAARAGERELLQVLYRQGLLPTVAEVTRRIRHTAKP